MARKHTHPYPADFRQKVVELARSGRGIHDLAAEFKLAGQTIRNWIKQADLNTGRRSDGLTTAEHEELAKLRKENRQLKIEREILGKAAAWFARESDSIPPKVFEFVKVHPAVWPVTTQCRVLEVSPSSFRGWLKRVPSKRCPANIVLGNRIVTWLRASFEMFGRPRKPIFAMRRSSAAMSG